MTFKDHFSAQAADYAAFRPAYPPALFAWLASLAPGRERAWDVATGNGQAAVALAAHFDDVWATDASAGQLQYATPHPRVRYREERAESCSLPDASCQLVTVAQALHWLNPAPFFAEARRVLVPDGLVAVWAYIDPSLDEPASDAMLQAFAARVRPFWPAERAVAETGYRSLAFPFVETAAPRFEMTRPVTREALAGYLRTWSATRRCVASGAGDPVDDLELQLPWAAGETHRLRWNLLIRAGRKTT